MQDPMRTATFDYIQAPSLAMRGKFSFQLAASFRSLPSSAYHSRFQICDFFLTSSSINSQASKASRR